MIKILALFLLTVCCGAGGEIISRPLLAQRERPLVPLLGQVLRVESAQILVTEEERLVGCASTDFMANFTIADRVFSLLVDTGSSTLAIASSDCSNCGDFPKYPLTGENMHKAAMGQYGDGSGWAGIVYKDTIAFGDEVGSISTNNFPFVAISSQSNGFFDFGSCQLHPSDEIPFQGILGLGYNSLAVSDTKSFSHVVNKPFRIEMCDRVGELAFGDTTTELLRMNLSSLVLSVIEARYYTVQVNSLAMVKSGNVVMSSIEFTQGSILDSGTTKLYLPAAMYNSVVDTLNADSQWVSAFGSDFWSNGGFCVSPNPSIWNETLMNEFLPRLAFSFPTSNGDCYQVQLAPTRSLVYPVVSVQSGRTFWCPGIASATSNLLIYGWTFMNQFVTIHDMANNQIILQPINDLPCDTQLTNGYGHAVPSQWNRPFVAKISGSSCPAFPASNPPITTISSAHVIQTSLFLGTAACLGILIMIEATFRL